jgi:hypothetical protein
LTDIAALIAIAGGAPVVLMGGYGLWEAWKTLGWAAVEGRILRATATLNSASELSDSFSPDISYEYVVDGAVHRGTRVRAGVRTFHPAHSTAADALGAYRTGASCRVHYDPSNPSQAVLRQGATFMHFVMPVLGALLMAAGIGGLAWK